MPRIPQEIIDAILDHFAGCHESSAVWRTCALVSKSFRPHSQRALFRHITIDAMDRPSLSRLHAVLVDNPRLGTHVRELSLSIRLTESLSQTFETLLDTLIRFTGLTSCTWVQAPLPSQWPIDETLRTKLYQFLRLPSLVKVVIHGADQVLVDFLASCGQLKSLAVNVSPGYLEDSVRFPGAGSISISTTRSTPASGQLEELIIHQHCILELVHSLASQSSRLHVSRLRKLTIIRSSSSFKLKELRKASQQMLDLCADALEELTCGKHLLSSFLSLLPHRQIRPLLISPSTDGMSSDVTGCFNLTHLTRLTLLRYFIPPRFEVELWLQRFLRLSIGTPNSLQVITLRLPPSFSRDEWNALDVILSNATSISRAHLSLVLFHSSSDYARRLGDDFMAPELRKEYLPNLMERGGFSINIEFWPGVPEEVISLPSLQSSNGLIGIRDAHRG